jgi:hypothetical protein
MASGSCLCGAIAFEFDSEGCVVAVGCSCSNCRKISGSQYGIYLQVKIASFRWLSGADQISTYESSPGNHRGFCGRCGSVAPVRTSYGAIRVPAGALDEDPGVVPEVWIFSGSTVPWCEAEQAEQRFTDSGPQAFWGTVIRRLHGLG